MQTLLANDTVDLIACSLQDIQNIFNPDFAFLGIVTKRAS